MLNHIEIRNFRGLSALDLELFPTTVLVGPNSCGKTSVLHGVQLACSALSFAVARGKVDIADDGWLTLYKDETLRDDQSFLPTNRWHELFSDANPEHGIKILLRFSAEHAIEQLLVNLRAGRADALRMTVKVRISDGHPLHRIIGASGKRGRRRSRASTPDLPADRDELGAGEAMNRLGLFSQLSDHFPRAILVPAFYGVVREEEYRARGAVEALLQGGQQGLVVRNLLIRLPNLEGINAFLPLAGLQAKVERCTSLQETDTVRHLEVLFRDRNGLLELSSAGTGLASLLALYAAIQLYQSARAEGRAVIFMLDEPEAHLHPRLQGDVAVKLLEMVTAAGNQLLCATHSVEMINRFGRDPRVAVLRIDRQAGAPRALRSEDDLMDELSAWCDLSPFARLNLLASRRILFFEGTSDRKILGACARLYLGSDPIRLKRFEDFTSAPLSGTGNMDAKEVLKRALLPIFQQLPPGESIRVVRILDRDYSRSPKFETQDDSAAHYKELDVVWSRHSIESLFLEPECLADWLDAALKAPGQPAKLDRGALLRLVEAALKAADGDAALKDAAVAQLTPHLLAQGRADRQITAAVEEALRRVESEPSIYQRGHDRDRFVLNHIRQALLDDPQTRRLANRVRRDIAQMVSESPLAPNLLLPPALIPPEIKQVLDFMAAS